MVDREKINSNDQYTVDIIAALAKHSITRLWITIILLIVLLFGSNAAWIIRESQFVETETTITQENEDGYNNFIGNDGDIQNGKTDDHGSDENP